MTGSLPETAAAMRALRLPPFRERAPWWGGDLQTVRTRLMGAGADPGVWPHERLDLALDDGDVVPASLHAAGDMTRPLAVLVHGLTGCEDSAYVRRTAAVLLAAGWPVLRLNLRGAGPARQSCRGHYHAGRTEDLAAMLASLPAGLTDRGVVAVGYSLGGSMLLRLLGETGSAAPVLAAASVSAPLDLAVCAAAFLRSRNAVYHRSLLGRMRREATAGAAAVTPGERAAIASARTIPEFDETFIAPRFGFAGAADYYARCSAAPMLPEVRVPTLVVHGLNDPWIPRGPHDRVAWDRNPWLAPAVVAGGGHVGFHGRGSSVPWHDRALMAFLEAVFGPDPAATVPPRRRRSYRPAASRRAASGAK